MKVISAALLTLAALLLAACARTEFMPPDVQGAPLMAAVDGKPVLLVLTRQEERRVARTWAGRWGWSTENRYLLFHFDLRAYDPTTATPLWRARLVTFNDPEYKSRWPQVRVVGSTNTGSLLGQDGDRIWLQIADSPLAVSATDGARLIDAAQIEESNPLLAGKLPSEARFYGFDRGLVIHAADAQRWVLRGPDLKAEPWTPVAAPAEPVPLKGNGMPKIIPARPSGDAPTRMAMLGGSRIGLYTPREATEAANDEFGDRFAYPYSILDERVQARRTFWTVQTKQVERFRERYERITQLDPVADSAVFLRGRFLKQLPGEQALAATDPDGAFIWHSSRMDDEGRLSLTRVDAALKPQWTVELPLSETSTANPVRYWLIDNHVVVMGERSHEVEYATRREPFLVSVSLADGTMVAHNLRREATHPLDVSRVGPRIPGD
jgi:hypothetical protein